MRTILDTIVQDKLAELIDRKKQVAQRDLEQMISCLPPTKNFSGALMGDEMRLIAEIKKASPSKGILREDFDPESLAKDYVSNGAAAVSVLTNSHFHGNIRQLTEVKQAIASEEIPVLCKDFILDPFQIFEARAYGADAILLIVSILSQTELKNLIELSQQLWIQCLVEIHNEDELLRALDAGADIIGVNNRDLRTFITDLAVTERLAPKIPKGKVIVSESGITSYTDLTGLKRLGVHAVLVGETLVTNKNPGRAVRELLTGTEGD